MTHSDITGMLDHQRRREMLAAADRDRLASLVRRDQPATTADGPKIPLRADVRG